MTDSETGATLMPRQPISSTRSISTELHHVPSGPRHFSQLNISTTMSLYKLLSPPRPYLISTEYSHLLTLTEKSLKTFCWSGGARWLANELHHFKLWMLQNKQNLTCKPSMFRVGLGSGFAQNELRIILDNCLCPFSRTQFVPVLPKTILEPYICVI